MRDNTTTAGGRRQPPNVLKVAVGLGLEVQRHRWTPCPACGAAQDRAKRGVLLVRETSWWCASCHTGGDGFDLVAWSLLGCRGRDAGSRFRQVLAWLDNQALVELDVLPVVDEAPLMDEAELGRVLARSTPAAQVAPVAVYLAGRGYEPERCPAWVLPADLDEDWWPAWRHRRYPLVVPAYTGAGTLAGLHGARIDGRTEPKSMWAAKRRASGLVFACPAALAWLRGGPRPAEVLVVEGVTDFLGWASRGELPVVGVESGSASAVQAMPWRVGAVVWTATDNDPAGDRYAEALRRYLPRHVITRRCYADKALRRVR